MAAWKPQPLAKQPLIRGTAVWRVISVSINITPRPGPPSGATAPALSSGGVPKSRDSNKLIDTLHWGTRQAGVALDMPELLLNLPVAAAAAVAAVAAGQVCGRPPEPPGNRSPAPSDRNLCASRGAAATHAVSAPSGR